MLGQHYLTDSSVIKSMVGLAAIRPGERVLEIGTGRGALTRELVRQTVNLEGYEVDRKSCEGLRKELSMDSLVLHNEDAFKCSPTFDVLLSSLPYSESSNFVEWLSRRRYDRAVVLLQRDFARKITAPPGAPAYRAISVISQASARVEIISDISRMSFDPPPRVNSSLVMMRWKRTLSTEQTGMIKRIFSQKRRTVRAALRSLGLAAPPFAPEIVKNKMLECRVNSIRTESVLLVVDMLTRTNQTQDEVA